MLWWCVLAVFWLLIPDVFWVIVTLVATCACILIFVIIPGLMCAQALVDYSGDHKYNLPYPQDSWYPLALTLFGLLIVVTIIAVSIKWRRIGKITIHVATAFAIFMATAFMQSSHPVTTMILLVSAVAFEVVWGKCKCPWRIYLGEKRGIVDHVQRFLFRLVMLVVFVSTYTAYSPDDLLDYRLK